MEKVLLDKTSIIIDACSSVSSAIAKRFAQEGAKLILISKNPDKLKLLSKEIQEIGAEVISISTDFEKLDNIKEVANSITSKYKHLDILISNTMLAGESKLIHEYDYDSWKSIANTNLVINWYLIKYFDSLLKRSSAGRVVFVTSEVTQLPENYSYHGIYAANQAALESLAKIYSTEVKHSKICVNIVHPDPVKNEEYFQESCKQTFYELQPIIPQELIDKFVELASESFTLSGTSHKLPHITHSDSEKQSL